MKRDMHNASEYEYCLVLSEIHHYDIDLQKTSEKWLLELSDFTIEYRISMALSLLF